MAESSSAIPISRQEHEVFTRAVPGPVPVINEPSATERIEDASAAAYSAGERAYRKAQTDVLVLVSRLRNSVRQFAREKPFHLIAAVAVASFFGGVALRVWRSRHEP